MATWWLQKALLCDLHKSSWKATHPEAHTRKSSFRHISLLGSDPYSQKQLSPVCSKFVIEDMAQASMPHFTPTPEDWVKHWPTIMFLFWCGDDGKPLTYKKLAEAMKCTGFTASPKMYFDRINRKAGVKRNLKAAEKAALGEQMVSDYRSRREIPAIELDKLKKIIRHHPKTLPEALQNLNALKAIRASLTTATAKTLNDMPAQQSWQPMITADEEWSVGDEEDDDLLSSTPDWDMLEALGLDDIHNTWMDSGDDYTGWQVSPDPSEGSRTMGPQDGYRFAVSTESFRLLPSTANHFDLTTTKTFPRIEMDHVPMHGFARGLESLFHHTQEYYRTRQQTALEHVDIAHQHQSKEFWTFLKSAIYFYKDDGDQRALPMMLKVGEQIPDICAAQTLSLLRELLTTLSLGNTNIRHGLRKLLLERFARHLHNPGHFDHHLYIICSLLLQDWVSDNIHTVLLCVLLRITEDHPDPFDREIVELHRSRLQVLRRMGDLVAANSSATESREKVEATHGPDAEPTRLIMSEQVHILSAQGKPEEALELAKDIVRRAERWDGAAYPTQRSIYHLEDVAEIQKRLGRFEEAVALMERALKRAKQIRAHPDNALHLQHKLESLRADLAQLQLRSTSC